MPNYPNKNRTKEERKARYCFLRHIGFCRDVVRRVVGFRDTKIILFLENNYNKREMECIDYRKTKRKTKKILV